MSLNIYQQTFALSFLSNSGESIENLTSNGSESINSQFETAFENKISQVLSTQLPELNSASSASWRTVWGPVVYVDPTDVKAGKTDNTFDAAVTNCLIIFQNGSQYVVATSGTSFGSSFDASVEDAEVVSLKPWPYNSSFDARISNGTFKGLSILSQMMDANQQTAADFLAGITDANAEIIVAGHSLGGALCEALAVALCDENSTLNSALATKMKNSGWSRYAYPSAAPDIGNDGFVQLFRQVFESLSPQSGDQAWEQFNSKIWNSLDVVPQSWANLDAVASIYGSDLSTPDYVKCIIDRTDDAIKAVNLGKNPYASLDPNKIGQFNGRFCSDLSGTSITDDCSSASSSTCSDGSMVPSGVCEFVGQMLYQHIDGYIDLILGESSDILPFVGNVSACESSSALYNKNILYCKTQVAKASEVVV